MNRVSSALAALILGLASAGCGQEEPLPQTGARLTAERAALKKLLLPMLRLEGTRLAREAQALLTALPDCDSIESQAPNGDFAALREGLHCSKAGENSPLTDDWPVTLQWPLETGGTIEARLRHGPSGEIEIDARLPRPEANALPALLIPAAKPVGPAILSSRERLLHARFRPAGGIQIARLVKSGSQADQLFRLKSALFSGAVLDGTWESAIYLPARPGALTRAALALGFQRRSLATAAMEHFIEDLRKTWPVTRTPFAFGLATGACLLDMNVLPGLAPCYLATDRAIVVGWNPASLRLALEPQGPLDDSGAATLGERGGVWVDLDRFAEADARLAAETGDTPSTLVLPWRRLRIEPETSGGDVLVRVWLTPAEDS